ncbi:alpha/beta hydrolase [Camelliibacillus cellulosilyticus]|uniref:Alpha/beta hydrolase n=1 Tax=Camelliibacillus cellulosilyticus TaxID=2174486 RepID=A0ABV9GN70_9BACL
MKILPPKPFTFEAGPRAVLLLHGFTGNSADVRMLGRFLEGKGYTCHAPHYKGHGVPPEELLHTGPEDWWKDVQNAIQHLKDLGYDEIAVCGLSLGGVFSLKVGYTYPIKGIVPMCAPMTTNTEEKIYHGVLKYAREWKQLEGKSEEQVEKEMAAFKDAPMEALTGHLRDLLQDVNTHIGEIKAPTFVVQARHDEMIDANSANMIYDKIQSPDKKIKWYEHSTHVITLGDEKEQLHKDIYEFLEGLDWTVS